ncbi:MAG: hypothetical protein JWO83_1542 [Caulobacteraceae bacterium]|nr:hypothetical protein [Caulobacteraceae bacterium]
MTTLSQAQANILAAAAQGDIEPTPQTKKSALALIKRGLLILVPDGDGKGFLTITPAGRAATGPGSSGDADGGGETLSSSEPKGTSNDDAPPVEIAVAAAAPKEPKGKIQALLILLRRPQGARLEELMAATGWQAHSVRGAMSGAIKKKLGIAVISQKTDAGRVYRVEEGEAA